jgi:DNA-binding IclR family transcriptional regulator
VAEQSKTVDAALRLLGILGTRREGVREGEPGEAPATARGSDGSAASFARRLHLSRTAVGRILATLEAHGLARRTERGWDLGLGVLSLAGRIEPVLRAAARPTIEDLAARFGETAVLALQDGAEVVAVDQVVAARRLVQVRYRPGTRHPLENAAHGRALLPEGSAAGYVVARGQPEDEVTGVAAPIFAGATTPVASLGLVAPAPRFPPEAEVVSAVRAAARTVTAELGGRSTTEEGGDDAVLPARR